MPAIDPELQSKLDSRRRRLDSVDASSPRALAVVAGQAPPEADFELVPVSSQYGRSAPHAYSTAPVHQHANPAYADGEEPRTPEQHVRTVRLDLGWIVLRCSPPACLQTVQSPGSASQTLPHVFRDQQGQGVCDSLLLRFKM
jgi:hypothetical protein